MIKLILSLMLMFCFCGKISYNKRLAEHIKIRELHALKSHETIDLNKVNGFNEILFELITEIRWPDSIIDSNSNAFLDSMISLCIDNKLSYEKYKIIFNSLVTNVSKVKGGDGATAILLSFIIDSCSLSYLNDTTLNQVKELVNKQPNVAIKSIEQVKGTPGRHREFIKFGPDIVYQDDTIPNIYFIHIEYDSKGIYFGGYTYTNILQMNSDSTFDIIETKSVGYFH